jgi:hypothetical protein
VKCANRHAITSLGSSLLPLQLGVGVSGGCKVANHANQQFPANRPHNYALVKLDFFNVLNSYRRDAVMVAVVDTAPDISKFCHLAYDHTSILQFGQCTIYSHSVQ